MARLARKQLADLRALEEEAERTNPVAPMEGAGATPSMGLSQFRAGGAIRTSISKHISTKALARKEAPSVHNLEMDAMAEMPSGEYGRSGMSGGAKAQGEQLAKHLQSLHGKDFTKNFHAGMSMACGGSQTGAYEGEGLHGGFLGTLASLAMPLIGKLFGSGKMDKDAHDQLMSLFKKRKMAGMSGAGRIVGGGELEVEIKHSKHGGGAATDGRKRRAEIVRKVMKEQGLSMIEASKYVKAHGLYK